MSTSSGIEDMDAFAGLRAMIADVSQTLKPNENNVKLIRPYAKYLLSVEDKIFADKVQRTREVMNARRSAAAELVALASRNDALSEVEANRLRVLKEVIRRRDVKLAASNRKRDAHARELKEENLDTFLNVDESCAINAVIEAVSRISPKYWLGDDKASEDLQALIDQPGKVKNGNLFRAAIGEEYEEVENGKIGWFPPRIFMKSILMRMDKLRNSATSVISVNGGKPTPRAYLTLIATTPSSIDELLVNNQIQFVKLPRVVILNIVWNTETWYEYERELTLSDRDGIAWFKLKSIVNSYYGFHTDFNDPNTFETPSSGHSADILIYEKA